MANTIQYSFATAVENGPSMSAAAEIAVAAYSVINQEVDDGQSMPIDVSPDAPGKILIMVATRYEDLTYSVTGGATDVPFDGPQLFIGSGAIGLLNNGAAVQTITVNNTRVGTESVEITILIGRDAS